jgi:hypothetical protein
VGEPPVCVLAVRSCACVCALPEVSGWLPSALEKYQDYFLGQFNSAYRGFYRHGSAVKDELQSIGYVYTLTKIKNLTVY